MIELLGGIIIGVLGLGLVGWWALKRIAKGSFEDIGPKFRGH